MDIFNVINDYYRGKSNVNSITFDNKEMNILFQTGIKMTFKKSNLINVYFDSCFYFDFDEQDIMPFLTELEDAKIVFNNNRVKIVSDLNMVIKSNDINFKKIKK